MLKKVWRDPVGSNVIAGLVLVACGAAATYLLNWWPSIIRAVMAAWRFLWQRTAVPNAVVGLLLILASATVIRAVALRSAGRTWRDYKSDVFFGLRWRWSYYGGAILGLASFCPRCDFQVYPQHDSPSVPLSESRTGATPAAISPRSTSR